MNNTAKLGAAVAGGYVLGRTKKGKAAIGLALFMAGRRAGSGSLTSLLSSSGVGKLAGELGRPLKAAARQAVTSTVDSKVNSLADGLEQRTNRLRGSAGRATKAVGSGPSNGADKSDRNQGEQSKGNGDRDKSTRTADRSGSADDEQTSSTRARSRRAAASGDRAAHRRAPSRSRETSRQSRE